jgi:hypothetical protein
MSDTVCQKCGMRFESGKIYGVYCQHRPNCGPFSPDPMTVIPPSTWLDPMPRQDVKLPPPVGYVDRADYDAIAAEVEALRKRLDEAHKAGLREAADACESLSCFYRRTGEKSDALMEARRAILALISKDTPK